MQFHMNTEHLEESENLFNLSFFLDTYIKG